MITETAYFLTDNEVGIVATELHRVDCGCADFGDPWTDEDARYIRAAVAASHKITEYREAHR